MQLTDNHNRPINYLRISVTDRCNLRCTYCMPEQGLQFEHKKNLLTFPEMSQLIRIFSEMGVDKVRFTGGEPFVRDGMMQLIQEVSGLNGLDEISITTNGTVLNEEQLRTLKASKVRTINLSLDSLDRDTFKEITRRDNFTAVMKNLDLIIKYGFDVKVNCVVMPDKNIQEIQSFVEFTKDKPVTARFLEEMPFNGASRDFNGIKWNHVKILDHITKLYTNCEQLPVPESSTSSLYQVRGHQGKFGIIPSFSRTFCGTCNRVRVSHHGMMRTCLYGENVLDLKELLRSGTSEDEIKEQIVNVIQKRAKDGFEAQANRSIKESMTKIGG